LQTPLLAIDFPSFNIATYESVFLPGSTVFVFSASSVSSFFFLLRQRLQTLLSLLNRSHNFFSLFFPFSTALCRKATSIPRPPHMDRFRTLLTTNSLGLGFFFFPFTAPIFSSFLKSTEGLTDGNFSPVRPLWFVSPPLKPERPNSWISHRIFAF